MNALHELPVLILGLGDSGLAMARWCARHGALLRVWDSRSNPPQAAALAADVPGAVLFSGALAAESLLDAKLVLKSPGLAPGDERIAPLLQAARAVGIAVQGELDLFARALAELKAARRYEPKVLAITGTNGKTTTTALTALLVERAGRRVAIAGNIGPTMLDTLSAALDLEPAPETALEVLVEAQAVPELPASPEMLPAETEAEAEPAANDEMLEPDDDVVDPLELTELAALDGAPEPADAPMAGALPEDETPLVLAPPPPAAPVFEHLPEVWVLELSSFQLDGVQGFEPSAATVLNISQDHLDWHGNLAAYAAAKARVFGPQTLMVINRDDAMVEAMVPAPVLVKTGRGRPTRALTRPVLRFGLDAPHKAGDFGLVTEGGMAWLVRALPADETIKRRKDEEEEIHLQRLMPADALRVRGRHNAANALAALALATAIGCPLAPMLHGLREYRGEPHRVELIAQVGGIEAFDDSKGTNVGATVAALSGLGADKAPSRLVVILGGDGKGQDFTPLAAPIARYARAVATIGRDAETIAQTLAATGVPLQRHATLEAAVPWCFEQAQPGDAVLLSPACASLDMFRNYAHRAEVFAAAVQALLAERGEIGT
ncbi:UDP-N-acetylmuramoyl-L-alanine--D-glutamate ligase [Ideonella sp.]|uniref:UDP-N-acetylmuramoyl-L-alanine--D-glutamate ligase n=1 Tax=Ideonella sp. TaxID=1929293 RepID=UPI00351BCE36